VGLCAGFLTTASFLPQVVRTVRTKSSRDLSLGMVILFIAGILMWLLFGIMKGEWPIIIANAVTFFLAIILLVCKVKYK
jgi:MtN3 and saliva related transmembrane protein